jgi:protein TonB
VTKHRYKVSFFLTTILYFSLIVIYLYIQTKSIIADQKPQDRAIEISISSFIPEVQEEVLEEPEIIDIPKPTIEPIMDLHKKVEIIKPKTVNKSKPKKIKKVKKKLKRKIKKRKKAIKKPLKKPLKTAKGRKKRGVTKNNRAKANQFFSKIRQRINRNKSYPKIAKRRGIQGKVKVTFTILSNGNVGNISVKGAKVFHKSARSAVKKAFPVNIKNIAISLPKSVNFTLHYQLK